MKKNSTIDDVAKAAGVARVTVSRVLNNGANVRPETRERVRRAVDELGYSVNLQARALASGTGRLIVLLHPHNPEREPNSYYHAGLELGALRVCASRGLDLVTRSIDPSEANTPAVLKSIFEREKPAGIILCPPLSDDLELLDKARRLGVRIVAVSSGEAGEQAAPGVGIDERAAGRLIAEHLISLGHRRLGFVKGPEEHRAAANRFCGFAEAMADAGISEPPWAHDGDFTFKSGIDAAERLLDDRTGVTALACANDDMAAGAMLTLHRRGVAIPESICVTGFDDTPLSEVVWPPLTTIRQPIKRLAERAVIMLLDMDSEPGEPPPHETLPYELVVRESTSQRRVDAA